MEKCAALLGFLVGVIVLSGCGTPDPFRQNARLGRGINVGNALEAPREGEWGVTLEADYFRLIKEAGFDSVRIPVRWSAHAETNAPYTIDPAFFARVDWAVGHALSNGLAVVLNIHHYDDLMKSPDEQKERFWALWRQIGEHYRGYPDELMMEPLNEPHDALTAERWNYILSETIALFRLVDPRRTLIADPASWGGWRELEKLVLPSDARNLIVSFHYYDPFHFTHQGAGWVQASEPWLGTTWTGSDAERQEIVKAMDAAAAWGRKNGRPLYMGEFGAFDKADMTSRARWTSFVAREAERHGFSWAYWEFCAGFGAYDPKARAWRPELLGALIPER